MGAKKYDGPDKAKLCTMCAASKITCESFYKRDKGMPSCCSECFHDKEGDENE